MHVGRPQLLLVTIAVSALTLLAFASVHVAAENGAERVFREARAYTVRIRTQITTPFVTDTRGSFEGAGFLVDATRGWIVTNAHVVGQSPSEVHVAFDGEDFQVAEKVYVDCFADIAVLAIRDVGEGRRAAKLALGDEVRMGEAVGAFGHPMGMYFTGTRGIVSGETDQFGADLIQIDATVDHGNSGGPTIALADGKVIGIATATMRGDKSDRVNFATPIDEVGRILELLRAGTIPSPPILRFSLLRDETGSHRLEVAGTHDSRRWPFQPGDRILGLEGGAETRTLSDVMSALRGATGAVPLAIERGGRRSVVRVEPELAPRVTHQQGIQVDGALIASIAFDDGNDESDTRRLFVHSLDPGSTAETMQIEEMDMVHTIDGRSFRDLETLRAYLDERPKGRPLKLVLCRSSGYFDRWRDFHVRELPGEDIHPVGPAAEALAAKQDGA